MRIVTLRNVLACALLAGVPRLAAAQPAYDDASAEIDVSVGGQPIDSVDVFYDQLSPYGAWIDDPDLGRVFAPPSADFVPYSDGHWRYTDVGMVWESAQPFEWATAHYGRWAYSRAYGRWVWMPDTTWGPAWVEWRESGDDYGWAPLAPDVEVSVGYQPPIESWHYCGAGHILDADVQRYYEPRARVVEIHRDARPVERYGRVSGARVVVGPSAAELRQHHVDAKPAKLDEHAVGRWTQPQVQAADKRAQEQRANDEQQNRTRVERDAALSRAKAKPAAAPTAGEKPRAVQPAPQPARVEPAKPEPARPAPARVEPVKREPAPARVEPVKRGPVPARTEPAPPPVQREPVSKRPEPGRTEPTRTAPPQQEPGRPEPAPTPAPAPARREPTAEPTPRAVPAPPAAEPQRAQPARPEPKQQRVPAPAPAHPAPPPAHPAPAPQKPAAAPAPHRDAPPQRAAPPHQKRDDQGQR